MAMFQKASKKTARLRLALIGPSGSGKTYSALALATQIGKRVAVIDTERGTASKYADRFAFDTLDLATHAPDRYVEAIKAAESEGYDVIVIDSLSHAWMGKDGALEQVDKAAKRSQSGNTFTAWRDVTPQHNRLVDSIVGSSAHVIVTMRTKTEYVLEDNGKGKKMPRRVGLAPIQRDGLEYEFDVVGEMNLENELVVSKSRCPALTRGVFHEPGADVAAKLTAWLSDGEPPQPTLVSNEEDGFVAALRDATDLDALGVIAGQIKASATLSAEARARLRREYDITRKAIERGAELDRMADQAAGAAQ